MSIFSKAWKAVINPVKKVVSKVTDVLGEDLTTALAIAAAAYGGYAYLSGGTAAAGTTAAGATGTAATGATATSATTAAGATGTTTIAAGSTLTASELAATGLEVGTSTAQAASLGTKLTGYAKTAGTALSVANAGMSLVSSIQATKAEEEAAEKIKALEEKEKANKTAELWSLRKQLTQSVGTTSGTGTSTTSKALLGFSLG